MRLNIASAALVAGALVLLATDQSFAQAPYVDRLEVTQTGFMTVRKTGKTTEAPGTAAGYAQEAEDMKFVPETPANTARIGMVFGAKFRVMGRPHNAGVNLRAVWRIPEPGITNPKTGNTYRQDISEFTVSIGEERTRAFGFDETWEIARGTWTLELWQDDRKLLEQSFKIE
jgi:hypothetical protein